MAPPPSKAAAAASQDAPAPAPAATSSTRNSAARRPAANRPIIVPAIPIPYMHRRRKPSQPAVASAAPPTAVESKQTSTSDLPTRRDPQPQPASSDDNNNSTTTKDEQGPADGHVDGSVNEQPAEELGALKDIPASATADNTSAPGHTPSVEGEVTPPENVPSAPSSASFRPSAASPLPYNMPPPFQPAAHPAASHGPVPVMGPESVRLPPAPFGQGRSHMHQHHPSNGSLVFGGFHGSNTSSPVPNSGGMFPPPPVVPYHPDQLHMAAFEYGPPMIATGPMDGYMPASNNYGPSTPHDSQGSMPLEENGYMQHTYVNGHGSHDPKRYSGPSEPPSARYPPSATHTPGLDIENQDDINRTVQQAFSNPEFADCELNLHLPVTRRSEGASSPGYRVPVVVPAHRLILARSPTLRNIMRTHGIHNGKLSVSSDDPYIRSDAFWLAIQALYGYPLQDFHPDSADGDQNANQLDMALGYAASGSLLQLFPILAQGVRDAARFVGWTTLEKQLDFAMAGATVMYPTSMELPHSQQFLVPQYRDGPVIHELVTSVVSFLIDNFPPNFILDTGVADSRFPRIPSTPTPASPRSAPPIVHGTSSSTGSTHILRLSQNFSQEAPNARMSSNPRLSKIQFGDISPAKNDDQPTKGPRAPAPVPDALTTSLSRVLIDLPFDLLKLVLESHGLGNVSGWMTTQDRHRVISGVVAERETRRLRAVDAIRAGRVPNSHSIYSRLSSREPQVVGDVWDALGWKEDVSPESTEVPIMVRTWAPLE